MWGILVGSTVLIPVILMIRWLTRERVSMRFRYALWLLVALRLLLPVNFGSSPYSALNLADRTADYLVGRLPGNLEEGEGSDARLNGLAAQTGAKERQTIRDGVSGAGIELERTGHLPGYGEGEGEGTKERPSKEKDGTVDRWIRRKGILPWILSVWFAGMLGVGCFMLAGQRRLVIFLKRARKEIPFTEILQVWARRLMGRGMKVYLVEGLPVPCLVGRGIYLNPQLREEKERLCHVLAHEYAHAMQKDPFWAFLRSMLCAVYWFDPLVWLAAHKARQDSELACDERALSLLGKEQRFAYGRTLLELISSGREKERYEGVALYMDGSSRRIKERVLMIAGRRKHKKAVAVCVALMAVAAGGCTFTGAGAEQVFGDVEEQSPIKPDPGAVSGMDQEARSIEQAESKMINERLTVVEEESSHPAESEFSEWLYKTEDDGLILASQVDVTGYINYLYEEEECPLKDGTWYLLGGEEEADISFYGLYTKQYGLRGFKMMVGEDVNTFDLPWLPSFMEPEVEVLEWAKDGMPRTFVFQLLRKEDERHEIWKLYLADRYDTGTVSLYEFEEADYIKQMEEMVEFKVDKEARKVDLVCGQNVVGSIDISRYADEEVKEAVLDGSAVRFWLDASSTEDGAEVFMVTCVGLRTQETEMVRYSGLPCVVFPVDIGTWDERTFRLGMPGVDTNWVNGMLDSEE